MAYSEVQVMDKIRNLIIIAASVVVLLSAVNVYLLLNEPQKSTGIVVFKELEPIDVTGVEIHNTTGDFKIYMKDGGYIIDDIPSELVDLDTFITFMTQCGAFSALKRITNQAENLAVYGLNNPSATAAITYSDGTELVLHIGCEDPVSGNYYMQVEPEDDDVYLISADTADLFLSSKKKYINHMVTPVLKSNNALSAVLNVTFTGGELKEPITIQAVTKNNDETMIAALSFGAITHLVHGNGLYELDQTYGSEILSSLFGIKANDVLGYGLTAEEINDYGFDKPYMKVEFDFKDLEGEQKHILLSLIMKTESSFLAYVEGTGVLYEISRPKFADIKYEKLMLRWFLSPLLMDISGLTVSFDDQTFEFDINTDEGNKQTVTLNGNEVDIDLFRLFYRLVTSASAADGEYMFGVKVEEKPLMTITYRYINSEKNDDVIKLYKGKTRRLNVEVNGVIEFDMKESFYTYLVNACKNILMGQEFNINW